MAGASSAKDRRERLLRVGVQSELVAALAEVLGERVSGIGHPCWAELVKTTHRLRPSLEPVMIGFDGVSGVGFGDVAGSGCQLVEHARGGRCLIRGHVSGLRSVLWGPGKEPVSGCYVAFLRHQHIGELVILVNGPVGVDPSPGELHRCFVRQPAIPGPVPAGSRRVT